MSQRTTEHQTKVCANANEHQESTFRNAYISITKFIDTLINQKVVNDKDELHLLFSNWRDNPIFNNRWTIGYSHYYIKREGHLFNIDEEVKKVLPTPRYIDFPVNQSLNPSTLTKEKGHRIKFDTERQPLGNFHYYKAEIIH